MNREAFYPKDLTPDQIEILQTLRYEFANLVDKINAEIPESSRYRSLAITSLEESAMWATKAVTHGS